MTTTDAHTAMPTPTSADSADSVDCTELAVRLSLKPSSEHPGSVQGAWWPRSRDLTVELPPLIAVLDSEWTQIDRATVNVTMWPEIPDVVRTGVHNVHVGWFDTEQERDDICLLTYLAGRWDLLVIPPETGLERAAQLMAEAADVDDRQTATELLTN